MFKASILNIVVEWQSDVISKVSHAIEIWLVPVTVDVQAKSVALSILMPNSHLSETSQS